MVGPTSFHRSALGQFIYRLQNERRDLLSSNILLSEDCDSRAFIFSTLPSSELLELHLQSVFHQPGTVLKWDMLVPFQLLDRVLWTILEGTFI